MSQREGLDEVEGERVVHKGLVVEGFDYVVGLRLWFGVQYRLGCPYHTVENSSIGVIKELRVDLVECIVGYVV